MKKPFIDIRIGTSIYSYPYTKDLIRGGINVYEPTIEGKFLRHFDSLGEAREILRKELQSPKIKKPYDKA
jgi:hypothetical protein